MKGRPLLVSKLPRRAAYSSRCAWVVAGGRPAKLGAPSSRRQCRIEVPQITIGRAFRAGTKQHRQHAKKHLVGDDDVGREVLQDLLQAFVLAGDGVGEAIGRRAGLYGGISSVRA